MSPARTKEPNQTLTDGQLVIGEVFAASDKFTAKDGDGNPIGTFPSIEGARSAVIDNRRNQVREVSRNG